MSSGASLSIEKLNKENYDTWKLQMEAILIKDDLWEYANASLWNKKDGKTRANIVLTMSSSELCQVKHCKPSHELSNKLKEVYESKEPTRKCNKGFSTQNGVIDLSKE